MSTFTGRIMLPTRMKLGSRARCGATSSGIADLRNGDHQRDTRLVSGDGVGSDLERAVAQGLRMVVEGADMLDVEESRHGRPSVRSALPRRRPGRKKCRGSPYA